MWDKKQKLPNPVLTEQQANEAAYRGIIGKVAQDIWQRSGGAEQAAWKKRSVAYESK